MNKKTTIVYYTGIGMVVILAAIFSEFSDTDIGYFIGLFVAPVLMWFSSKVLR